MISLIPICWLFWRLNSCGEQAIFNLDIEKKFGLSINPDIHHSKVFSSGYISIYKNIQNTFRIYNYIQGYSICRDIQYTFILYIYIQGYSIYIQDIYLYTRIFSIHSGFIFIYTDTQYTFRIYIYIQAYSIYIQDIY